MVKYKINWNTVFWHDYNIILSSYECYDVYCVVVISCYKLTITMLYLIYYILSELSDGVLDDSNESQSCRVVVCARKLIRQVRVVSLWIKSKIGFDFFSLNFYWLNYLYIYCWKPIIRSILLLIRIHGTDLIGYSSTIPFYFCKCVYNV